MNHLDMKASLRRHCNQQHPLRSPHTSDEADVSHFTGWWFGT